MPKISEEVLYNGARERISRLGLDVLVLVVPSDKLSYFLTDRGPSISAAKRHVAEARAEDLPLFLIALDHDGPGPRLPKQKKKVVE